MAYGRKYSRRRGYRRYRRTLSNRNVFGKTGAKSQARQIARLRNRVNYVARTCRPEIKQRYSGPSEFTFSNSATSSTWKAYPGIAPVLGTGDNERIGDFVRVKSLTWNFTFEYFDDRPATDSNPDSAGAMIRILILQWKQQAGVSSITEPQNVIQGYGSTGAEYTHNAVAPLKEGLTERFRILADRRFSITQSKNQIMKRIRVKPSNYRINQTAGTINNTFAMILVSGLHWDDSLYTQYVKGSFSDKVVYTDA